MCPSTETDAESHFAAEVLRKLLLRIDNANNDGDGPYLVSHAWTTGPMMYVVYTAPPSNRTWGLARDTRESNIDPGPWRDVDEAVLYYYLVDFEENQPSSSARRPGEPDTIRWFGYPLDGLPQRLSDIAESHRYTPSQATVSTNKVSKNRLVAEPRRYANRPPPESE